MKAMLKDAAILFVITLISGLVLGFVYDLTKDPIAAQELSKKQAAYKTVYADAADFKELYKAPAGDENTDSAGIKASDVAACIATKGIDAQVDEIIGALDNSGNITGYVLTVTDHEGYGGDITFAMGVTKDGTLNGVSILSISETAGLGMRADEVLVPQMPGKDMTQEITFTKNGGAAGNEVDAISGATITTTAFVNGINAGRAVFEGLLK